MTLVFSLDASGVALSDNAFWKSLWECYLENGLKQGKSERKEMS